MPNGMTPWPRLTFQTASQTLSASPAGAQISKPRSPVKPVRETMDRHLADLRPTEAEVGQRRRPPERGREEVARARALEREDGPILGDVVDLDVEPADQRSSK